MGVKIINKSEYPTDEVRKLVRQQIRDMEVDDVCVTVKHTTSKRNPGYTTGYYSPSWYPSKGEDRPQVTIRLPRPGVACDNYIPYQRTHTEQGKEFELRDWRDALVAVVAHELMHHRQSPRRQYGQSKGRGRFVEVEADLAAYRAVARRRGDL